jgi:hypothetical protein
LPLFAKKQISMKELLFMDDKDLKELEVSSKYIRKKIKAGVDEYQAMGERMKARFSGIENSTSADPSAPPTDMDDLAPTAPTLPSDEGAPSAPPIETFQSAECVVCMERKVDILNICFIILSILFLSVISSSFPVDTSAVAACVTETCHNVLCVDLQLHRG